MECEYFFDIKKPQKQENRENVSFKIKKASHFCEALIFSIFY